MEGRVREPRMTGDQQDRSVGTQPRQVQGCEDSGDFVFLKDVKKLKTVKTAPGNSPEG